jgi:hypothetical protein
MNTNTNNTNSQYISLSGQAPSSNILNIPSFPYHDDRST